MHPALSDIPNPLPSDVRPVNLRIPNYSHSELGTVNGLRDVLYRLVIINPQYWQNIWINSGIDRSIMIQFKSVEEQVETIRMIFAYLDKESSMPAEVLAKIPYKNLTGKGAYGKIKDCLGIVVADPELKTPKPLLVRPFATWLMDIGQCNQCSRIYPENGCSRCHTVLYCGLPCQKADWPNHKLRCGKEVGAVEWNHGKDQGKEQGKGMLIKEISQERDTEVADHVHSDSCTH